MTIMKICVPSLFSDIWINPLRVSLRLSVFVAKFRHKGAKAQSDAKGVLFIGTLAYWHISTFLSYFAAHVAHL